MKISFAEHGRLWLLVDGLFEISLTLSGPDPSSIWRLLSLNILVSDQPAPQTASQQNVDAGLVSLDQIKTLHDLLTTRLSTPGIRVGRIVGQRGNLFFKLPHVSRCD